MISSSTAPDKACVPAAGPDAASVIPVHLKAVARAKSEALARPIAASFYFGGAGLSCHTLMRTFRLRMVRGNSTRWMLHAPQSAIASKTEKLLSSIPFIRSSKAVSLTYDWHTGVLVSFAQIDVAESAHQHLRKSQRTCFEQTRSGAS